MPRPRKHRFCRRYRADRVFKPQGLSMREISTTTIDLDEFEALRLCDVEQLDQAEAGEQMGVSRGTIQRLLYAGREKLVRAVLENDAILINLNSPEESDVDLHSKQRRRQRS
jgi:predicted DNA-binding protein (UPF0251 family)